MDTSQVLLIISLVLTSITGILTGLRFRSKCCCGEFRLTPAKAPPSESDSAPSDPSKSVMDPPSPPQDLEAQATPRGPAQPPRPKSQAPAPAQETTLTVPTRIQVHTVAN